MTSKTSRHNRAGHNASPFMLKSEGAMPHVAFLDFDDIKNPLLAGGQARATFEVARRLVKLGHEVTIICSRFPGSVDEHHEGIFYKHIGLGSSRIRVNNVVFFFALPFAVRALRADVIIECFTAPISTCFSPLFTKTPVIGMPTMFEAKEFAKKYHIPFHWVERFGAQLYDFFLAYSPLNREKMDGLNGKVITRIIPNGVGEELFDVPTRDNGYGAFIGRIDVRQKGLDLLLDACESVRDSLPMKIVIAGNGPREDEEQVKRMIRAKGLVGKVEFIGRVDGKRKEEFLANASFGVYPSRFEDFPLVPLEFTALGKPLVCFDIPGLAWVDLSVSLKAKPFDAQSLAGALVRMATDGEERHRLALGARHFAMQYGWNRIAEKYSEFCREVICIDTRRKNGMAQGGRKVVVLGGAGFIGSELAPYLYMRGDDVLVIDALLYNGQQRNFAPVAFRRGDIRKRGDIEYAIQWADVVVNLAALSNDPASDLEPDLTWEINYEANRLIVDLCRQYGTRLVYASSCSVYGFAEDGVFNEESVLNPVTLYAKTKMLSENIIFESGIDAIALRFATVYGYSPKTRFDLVVNTMIGNAYFHGAIAVNGGNQWRPLVHVRDVIEGIRLAVHAKELQHRIYNVGSNAQNYRIAELAREVVREFPAASLIENKTSHDGRSYQVDFSRIENELGFVAHYSVADAVREFREAFWRNEVVTIENDEYYRIKYLKRSNSLKPIMDLEVKPSMAKLGT